VDALGNEGAEIFIGAGVEETNGEVEEAVVEDDRVPLAGTRLAANLYKCFLCLSLFEEESVYVEGCFPFLVGTVFEVDSLGVIHRTAEDVVSFP